MSHYFVTGTDTGVGKTVVVAAILAALRERGVDALPFKPVQTGCLADADGFLRAPDVDFCLRMAGLDRLEKDAYARHAPCRYRPACSPHLAAEQADRPICLDSLLDCARQLAAEHACIVAEGAGGVLVPLNRSARMIDLMQRLGWSVIVATRPGLGTLNHTFLTLEALARRNVPVAGLVLVNRSAGPWGAVEESNRDTLEACAGVPLLGVVPHLGEGLEEARSAPARLVAAGQSIVEALSKPCAESGGTVPPDAARRAMKRMPR